MSRAILLAVSCMLLDCDCGHRHSCGDAALLKLRGCSCVCLRRGFDAPGIDSGLSSRVFNSRCGGGKLRSGMVSQANTSLSSANTRKFSPARRLLLLGITHWEQLGADVTGIQRLQMMLNCMRGVWAVEVEQEAFASEFTSVHRSRSWSCGTKMSRACHDRLEGASTPTRASQEESRPPKRGHPVPKARCLIGTSPTVAPSKRFQTLPYRRAYLCA